mgnify:CR=1 FL=1
MKKRRNNDKPRISDIMETVFDDGYLLFDLAPGIEIMGVPLLTILRYNNNDCRAKGDFCI